MTDWLMRRVLSLTLSRKPPLPLAVKAGESPLPKALHRQVSRHLAQVCKDDKTLPVISFTSSFPKPQPHNPGFGPDDGKPPDQRTLKLGKTIRMLQERLPTLLASPLPTEILSPQISLNLFPSTHPHLPTVTGRIPYTAALWTAPVAWGRIPVVGNVKLIIISERMVNNGAYSSGNERLIVKWRTCGKSKGRGVGALYRGISGGGDQVDKITEYLGGDVPDDEEFTGLFIFEFDDEGRILTHTIEHAEEGGDWEKKTRVVSVTDWLIGKAKGKNGEGEPGLAFGYCEAEHRNTHRTMSGPQRRRAGTK